MCWATGAAAPTAGERNGDNTVRLINLTDHDPLSLWSGGEVMLSIESSGVVRRIETHVELAPLVHDGVAVPTCEIAYGAVQDLPEPRPAIACVVSQLVVRAEPGRTDHFYPADLVRDKNGTPVGCRTLARASES